jgi:hypothetical protein
MPPYDVEKINTFVLRKQHLIPDSTNPDITTIVRDISGLHATAPTTPYLSLFARHPRFEKNLLENELYREKRLVKIRCIRKTLYIQTREMLPVVHAATRAGVEKASQGFMKARGISFDQYQRMCKDIMDLLSEKEMTASDLKKALRSTSEISSVLYFMCDQGILIRGKPEKGWRDKNQRYALFTSYFPDIDLNQFDENEAIRPLVEGYLASFGPVTESDILWWTGLGKIKINKALEELHAKVTHVSITGLEGEYLLLRSDVEPLSDSSASNKPAIHLLPYLDPYLMGYKERSRYLSPQHTNFVFDRTGNVTSTILIDGRIAGVWDFDELEKPTIKLHFFSPHPADIRIGVKNKAARLGTFIAEDEVRIRECDSMTPLTERTAGGFMSPLRQA